MKYYKSNNPIEQMDEAISILRKEVLREYAKNNDEVRGNKKEKTKLTIKGYCSKADMFQKVFHPAEYIYTISQLARKINMAEERNNNIISGDIRIQIAERIRQEMSNLNPSEVNLGVFAIEQLLQKKDNKLHNSSKGEFIKSMKKINVGIIKTSPYIRDELLKESEQIKNQYTLNEDKSEYLYYIVRKSHEMFGRKPQGMDAINNIEEEIEMNKNEALSRKRELKDNVERMLLEHGIETGFDTPLQTAWKEIKATVKTGFKKVISKISRKRLTSGGDEERKKEDGILPIGSNSEKTSDRLESMEEKQFRARLEGSDEVKRAVSKEIPRKYGEKTNRLENGDEILHTVIDDEAEIMNK